MSFLLVLVGTLLLVIGLLNSGLGLIYGSIASTVLAAVVLAVAVVRSRPQVEMAGGGPAAQPDLFGAGEQPAEGAVTVIERDEAPTTTFAFADEFPIADYDELKVSEILPLLDELDPDELETVLEREESGRNRATIKARVEQLLQSGPRDEWAEQGAPASGASSNGDRLPIAGYDELRVAQILPMLSVLDAGELREVRAYEAANAGRATILTRIDDLTGVSAAAPATTSTARSAGKRPATKKASKRPATKTTSKKATAAKTSSPTKKGPAKKAAPAKKSPAKKAAPAKKGPAKKAAPANKKAAPAKKSLAKKSPAKKAAKAAKRR